MRPVFIKLHGSFFSVFLVQFLSDFGTVFLLVFFVLIFGFAYRSCCVLIFVYIICAY